MNLPALYRPVYLWALGFLIVPVLLHFLNRRRTVRLDFSSLRFFKQTVVRTSRRRRLKRFLLLLTRLLIAAALVFLFAWPFRPGSPFATLFDPQGAVLVWVDPTPSMGYREEGRSRWDVASAIVDSMRRVLPPTSRCLLYDHESRRFREIAGGVAEDFVWKRYGPHGATEALQRIGDSEGARGGSVVVMVSDFQEGSGTVKSPAAIVEALTEDGKVSNPLLCVSVAPENPWNYSAGGARMSRENRALLQVTVQSRGRSLGRGQVVAVAGDMRVGHETVDVEEGYSVEILVQLGAEGGRRAGRVHLEVVDPFPEDNTDYYEAYARAATRVLVVGDLQQAYPLRAALGAVGDRHWDPIVAKLPGEVTADDLDSAGLVVLDGVRNPSPALRSLMSSRAFGRKGIVFSPGMDSLSMQWNRAVFEHLGLSPLPKLASAPRPLHPVLPDTVSATWRGFSVLRERDAEVGGYYRGLTGEVVCRLTDGSPLAVSVSGEVGHAWVVVGTRLGIGEANNLCETGFYVPFVDRLAAEAAAGVGRGEGRWLAGYHYTNPFFGSDRAADVYDAEGKVIARWDAQSSVVLGRPGLYRVRPDDGASFWKAVSVDPAEGAVVYRLPQVAHESLEVLSAERFVAFLHRRRNSSLTRALWAMLAFLLLCEVLLWASPFRGGKRSERA